jgi:hypothetical protein
VRLNGQFDHLNYPLKRKGQFASQNCPFKCTLAGLFDPNSFDQTVRLNTLNCTTKDIMVENDHEKGFPENGCAQKFSKFLSTLFTVPPKQTKYAMNLGKWFLALSFENVRVDFCKFQVIKRNCTNK